MLPELVRVRMPRQNTVDFRLPAGSPVGREHAQKSNLFGEEQPARVLARDPVPQFPITSGTVRRVADEPVHEFVFITRGPPFVLAPPLSDDVVQGVTNDFDMGRAVIAGRCAERRKTPSVDIRARLQDTAHSVPILQSQFIKYAQTNLPRIGPTPI